MSEAHIFAIFYPKDAASAQRLKELLTSQCKDVHEKENYTVRFMLTEQLDKDVPDFALFETYKDKASADKHVKEPHFKSFFEKMQSEGLCAKPPYVAQTKSIAGFDLDHNLL